MEINPISDFGGSNGIEGARLKGGIRQCLYYKEEHCTAPRIRFETCRSCCRINPHQAASNLFEKIKKLAADLFNLQEPEQPPRE